MTIVYKPCLAGCGGDAEYNEADQEFECHNDGCGNVEPMSRSDVKQGIANGSIKTRDAVPEDTQSDD